MKPPASSRSCLPIAALQFLLSALICSIPAQYAHAQTAVSAAQAQPANAEQITLLSPRNYQVFQRSTRRRGQILLSGKILSPCTRLEARISGRSLMGVLPERWIEVPFSTADMSFNTALPISAGGWYHVELRATIGIRVMARAAVDNVGVGEVFVGAGQSNSTNYGEEKLVPASGKVASFDGSEWRLAADPQPGAHDNSTGGSFWPAFGDAMYSHWHVPIGVAVTGHGGTSVNQWQPGSELFQWMMTRIFQLGRNGFRAVLWHQGESDTGMGFTEYVEKMTNLIEASTRSAAWQFPWIVAQATYHSPTEQSFAGIRDAQKRLWDSGVALEGPDTDTLTGDNRDQNGAGIHMSGKGERAHGELWARKVTGYLNGVLK